MEQRRFPASSTEVQLASFLSQARTVQCSAADYCKPCHLSLRCRRSCHCIFILPIVNSHALLSLRKYRGEEGRSPHGPDVQNYVHLEQLPADSSASYMLLLFARKSTQRLYIDVSFSGLVLRLYTIEELLCRQSFTTACSWLQPL